VFLIPGGDSDSLWYSYSPAYTAFGYQNVITMITGAESLYIFFFTDRQLSGKIEDDSMIANGALGRRYIQRF
jgi:hypothetical protein